MMRNQVALKKGKMLQRHHSTITLFTYPVSDASSDNAADVGLPCMAAKAVIESSRALLTRLQVPFPLFTGEEGRMPCEDKWCVL